VIYTRSFQPNYDVSGNLVRDLTIYLLDFSNGELGYVGMLLEDDIVV